MATGSTLLTGATGLLGSCLLKEGLERGHTFGVVIRPQGGLTATERFQVLQRTLDLDEAAGARVRVLAGDMKLPGLGLSTEDRAWVGQNVSRVLHNAGSVSFAYDPESEEPYATNVDGTRMLLVLCRELGLKEFHHVSTAYVCGLREGQILEDELNEGQVFANPYERSKLAAEVMVREADFLEHLTIYRPSAVLGDHATGYTPAFHSGYILLWGAWLLVCQGRSQSSVLGAFGLTGERLNVVTGDWCARCLWDLAVNEVSRGKTYHLTHQTPTPFSELFAVLNSCVSERLPALAEARYGDGIIADTYRPYLREHPTFDRTHLEADTEHAQCPELDREALERLVGYAVRKAFRPHQSFPIQAYFDSLKSSDRKASLFFEVPGPDGGSWPLTEVEGRLVPANSSSDELARVCCSEATLSALTGGHWSLEEALYSGGLAIQVGGSQVEETERLLATLVTQLSVGGTL